ncbi:hypothetical protein Y032_0024g900 [Ancylostoma ceylanicum]|nr:hypothetical protein Y032_0024g900 [Ancylostoma ceylanicum]
MTSTRTPRNRVARAGTIVVSRRSAISGRFSSQFGDLFTLFHVSLQELAQWQQTTSFPARAAWLRRVLVGAVNE